MPEVAYLPTNVVLDGDVVNFLRPQLSAPTQPPTGYRQVFSAFVDRIMLSAITNLGIPLSPDGNVRVFYDTTVPLTPKIKIKVGALEIASLDQAGNLTVAGVITGDTAP